MLQGGHGGGGRCALGDALQPRVPRGLLADVDGEQDGMPDVQGAASNTMTLPLLALTSVFFFFSSGLGVAVAAD